MLIEAAELLVAAGVACGWLWWARVRWRPTSPRSSTRRGSTPPSPRGPERQRSDELAVADVVAIPSVWESGPLVLAEALELGRPVVATPVGLVPEVVREGESGRIVPVGDAGRRPPPSPACSPTRGRSGDGRGRAAGRRAGVGADALVQATEALYRNLLARR